MNFAFTEEQEELRNTIRAFLEAKSSEEAVREQMDTEDGYDAAVWTQMAEQMGLQGLHIPEEYGGSGFSYVELGIVLMNDELKVRAPLSVNDDGSINCATEVPEGLAEKLPALSEETAVAALTMKMEELETEMAAARASAARPAPRQRLPGSSFSTCPARSARASCRPTLPRTTPTSPTRRKRSFS